MKTVKDCFAMLKVLPGAFCLYILGQIGIRGKEVYDVLHKLGCSHYPYLTLVCLDGSLVETLQAAPQMKWHTSDCP